MMILQLLLRKRKNFKFNAQTLLLGKEKIMLNLIKKLLKYNFMLLFKDIHNQRWLLRIQRCSH